MTDEEREAAKELKAAARDFAKEAGPRMEQALDSLPDGDEYVLVWRRDSGMPEGDKALAVMHSSRLLGPGTVPKLLRDVADIMEQAEQADRQMDRQMRAGFLRDQKVPEAC